MRTLWDGAWILDHYQSPHVWYMHACIRPCTCTIMLLLKYTACVCVLTGVHLLLWDIVILSCVAKLFPGIRIAVFLLAVFILSSVAKRFPGICGGMFGCICFIYLHTSCTMFICFVSLYTMTVFCF